MCIRDSYYIAPDDKENNIATYIVGVFIPFGDYGVEWIDEKWRDIEYFDDEDFLEGLETAISSGLTALEARITALKKVGLLDEAADLGFKIKALSRIGKALTFKEGTEIFTSNEPYISQITYFLYTEYLIKDKNRENLLARYGLLYSLVQKAVEKGAITYCVGHFYNETEFKVLPDSIKIDNELYQQIMDEAGYYPEDVIDLFPKED